jgi:hypothetical protein
MFLNDKYGDCVIAATANMTRNFENFEQGKDPAITDADVKTQYFKETGGADAGLVELDHLNTWRKSGFLAGGKVYTIHGFASVDWKNHDEVKYCIYLLNGIFLGLALPITAQSQTDLWTVVDPALQGNSAPGSWGYHAVIGQAYPSGTTPPPPLPPPKPGCIPGSKLLCLFAPKPRAVAYTVTGPVILTWGKRAVVTWDWWDAYVDEAYGIVDSVDDWVDPATDPLDIAKLDQMLADITS